MSGKEKYPKLLAVGYMPPCDWHNPEFDKLRGTLVYLIEDADMFYGYAPKQDGTYIETVRCAAWKAVALRWCVYIKHPFGSEDVEKMYAAVMKHIYDTSDLHYFEVKENVKRNGKSCEFDTDIEEQNRIVMQTPEILKKFLDCPVVY
jgi:hypothetical protein